MGQSLTLKAVVCAALWSLMTLPMHFNMDVFSGWQAGTVKI